MTIVHSIGPRVVTNVGDVLEDALRAKGTFMMRDTGDGWITSVPESWSPPPGGSALTQALHGLFQEMRPQAAARGQIIVFTSPDTFPAMDGALMRRLGNIELAQPDPEMIARLQAKSLGL